MAFLKGIVEIRPRDCELSHVGQKRDLPFTFWYALLPDKTTKVFFTQYEAIGWCRKAGHEYKLLPPE